MPLKWKPASRVPRSLTGSGLQPWVCVGKCACPNPASWQGGIAHSCNILYPCRKNNTSENGITNSVLLSRSLKWCWKTRDTQERVKVVFKKLEERVQISAAQFGPSALKQPQWPFPAAKGCGRQHIINFLVFRPRLDRLWPACLLRSTSRWAPDRAACRGAVHLAVGRPPAVPDSFFQFWALWKQIALLHRTPLFTLYVWTTQGSALNDHNLNTVDWVYQTN